MELPASSTPSQLNGELPTLECTQSVGQDKTTREETAMTAALEDEPFICKAITRSLECLPRQLPRRKYKPKARYIQATPHANTVTTMPEYERRKLLEQAELKLGRVNLQRVDARSMIV